MSSMSILIIYPREHQTLSDNIHFSENGAVYGLSGFRPEIRPVARIAASPQFSHALVQASHRECNLPEL